MYTEKSNNLFLLESEAVPVNIPLPRALLRRASVLPLAAALLISLAVPALAAENTEWPWRGATYIITRPGEDPVIIDGSTEPDLTGYPLVFRDSGRWRDLAVAARQNLTVRHDGEVYTLTSALLPFCELFGILGFSVSPLETVRIEISRDHVDVTVSTDVSYYERDTEITPYQTIRRANASMRRGEEAVVQVGAAGEKGGVYEVYWSHGVEAGRQLVEVLDSEPVDEIIEYGTAKTPQDAISPSDAGTDAGLPPDAGAVSVSREEEGGTLALPGGETLRFTKAISMTATAYTMGHGGVGAYTATGTAVRRGVVAVDRSVIPLGTKLYIVANGGAVYGEAVAEDTGVRGNRIDLYFDTYQECLQFGRRDCMVYILE